MASEQSELAFVQSFLHTISSQPVVYGKDYQQPKERWLRKVPVLPIPLPPPPNRERIFPAATSAPISVSFKSLKPPASYRILVFPTDTIASIKSQLASSEITAPPADAQRLLFKGKALTDGKLFREYLIQEGDTVNLVVKPGFEWDPSTIRTSEDEEQFQRRKQSELTLGVDSAAMNPGTIRTSASVKRPGHQRIPSVVLSPSPSVEMPGVAEKDIVLSMDSRTMTDGSVLAPEAMSPFSSTVSRPEFWEKLYAFLKGEFMGEGDALAAFENFFRASKGALTASQIAKIRDQVGIVGMAGT